MNAISSIAGSTFLRAAFLVSGLMLILLMASLPFATPAHAQDAASIDAATQTGTAAEDDDAPTSPFGHLLVYVEQMQGQAYRALAKAATALQIEMTGAATAALAGISFFYGIIHAMGPGHGKLVSSTWLFTRERRLRRGISISFFAAALQCVTAIVLVGALTMIAGLSTRITMNAITYVEKASFLMVAGLGLWMIWRGLKGGAAREAYQHGEFEYEEIAYEKRHAPRHRDDEGEQDHADQIIRRRETMMLILSVGLRPCGGAVLLLLFSAAIGAFWIGVLGTLAMALGTAVTIAVLGFFSVLLRLILLRLFNPAGRAGLARIERILGLLGGLIIFAAGTFLLVTSVTTPIGPFGIS